MYETMDLTPKTPQKLSKRNVENIYSICVICCVDITSTEGAKGRRYATHFQEILQQLDNQYCEVFNVNSPSSVYICKTCVANLKKISEVTKKCETVTKEKERQVTEFIKKTDQFKKQYMRWKRGYKASPSSSLAKQMKYRKIAVKMPISPSKLPVPSHPARSMPTPLQTFLQVVTPKNRPGAKLPKKLFAEKVSIFCIAFSDHRAKDKGGGKTPDASSVTPEHPSHAMDTLMDTLTVTPQAPHRTADTKFVYTPKPTSIKESTFVAKAQVRYDVENKNIRTRYFVDESWEVQAMRALVEGKEKRSVRLVNAVMADADCKSIATKAILHDLDNECKPVK
jgi:hypothetical protein